MPALHADETSLRVDGTNHWLHSIGAGDLRVKFVEDAHDHIWAKRLGHLLSGTCRRVSELDAKALDEAAFMAVRDIRMAKVKQTVSECFRTLRHAQAHCRISSSLQSMAHQGYNPLTVIQIALNGTAATMIKQERGASSYGFLY